MKQKQRSVLFKARRDLKVTYNELEGVVTEQFWSENPGGVKVGVPANESPMLLRWNVALDSVSRALQNINISLGKPRHS